MPVDLYLQKSRHLQWLTDVLSSILQNNTVGLSEIPSTANAAWWGFNIFRIKCAGVERSSCTWVTFRDAKNSVKSRFTLISQKLITCVTNHRGGIDFTSPEKGCRVIQTME